MTDYERGVADERRRAVEWAKNAASAHHRIAAETPQGDEMRIHSLALSRAYGAIADALERGEHEGGNHD